MNNTNNTLLSSKIIRNKVRGELRTIQIGRSRHTASGKSAPIEIVEGCDFAPKLVGLPYLKTTFRGPGGFTKTLYTYSTLKIIVGAEWNPYNRD